MSKFFLIAAFVCLCSNVFSQEKVSEGERNSVIQLLFEKGAITNSDTIHFKNFIKNISIFLFSTIDTCKNVRLLMANLPTSHSYRYYFISDKNEFLLLDFNDISDLLRYIGERLSNACSVSQKEKIRIVEYLLDDQKRRWINYRNR